MSIKDKMLESSKELEPIKGEVGATILGPKNPAREQENPDLLRPPRTDHGTLPNFHWSFADSHMRLEEGGWARQTTTRELPSSPQIGGVNMRLKSGGVREMHWHQAAEWSYMIKGKARITAVDQCGRTFQDDISEGDLWYFPAGIPHSIQGLGEDGCEFILVFDDGNFSEDSTFQLTDWLAHTPREVLAKNFGVPEEVLANLPKSERYIFQAPLPGPLQSNQPKGNGPVPLKFSHKMMEQTPIRTRSGTVRITDSSVFPISTTIAAGLVEVEPGGLRELHWHPNGDEWQFYLSGTARMTIFAAEGNARTFNFQAGDVGSVPMAFGHYVENIGDTPLRFLEIFRSDHFADISLSTWLSFTPHELVRAHLNVDESFLKHIQSRLGPVVPA